MNKISVNLRKSENGKRIKLNENLNFSKLIKWTIIAEICVKNL